MRKTPGDGLYSGTLTRGCTQCIRGAKMVLFVTGVCDVGCFYCPVSFRRANLIDEILLETPLAIISNPPAAGASQHQAT